jgi:hypothetical protein
MKYNTISNPWVFFLSAILFVTGNSVINTTVTHEFHPTDLQGVDNTSATPTSYFTLTPEPNYLRPYFIVSESESTSQDVLNTLQANRDAFRWEIEADENTEFDQATGYMLQGEYLFYWQADPQYIQEPSRMVIEDGILTYMGIVPLEGTTMAQILEIFSYPDHLISVHLVAANAPRGQFSLLYNTSRVWVSVLINNECRLRDFEHNIGVQNIAILSEENFAQASMDFPLSIPPPEVWQEWVESDSPASCLATLSQEYFNPSTPTPSATP